MDNIKNLRKTLKRFALYFADEGRYTIPMSLVDAKKLRAQFVEAFIVDARTGEIVG